MIKVITNTGSVHHLSQGGISDVTLCGRKFLREGKGAEITGRQCKNCTRLAERLATIDEMTRESLATINPTHPALKPGEPVEIFGTVAGEEILTAAVPNGDPERVAYFVREAERMGYSGVRAATVADPRTRQAYLNCLADDAAVEADTESERGAEGLPKDDGAKVYAVLTAGPQKGNIVDTPEGRGVVVDRDTARTEVLVRLHVGDDFTTSHGLWFQFDTVIVVGHDADALVWRINRMEPAGGASVNPESTPAPVTCTSCDVLGQPGVLVKANGITACNECGEEPYFETEFPKLRPVMHYGVPRILCGAEPEYIGSDHCKGGDGPCPSACDCGCKMGEFECICENATDVISDVTCSPCREGLHRPVDTDVRHDPEWIVPYARNGYVHPVDARSDAMMEQTASDDRTAPQDAVWDRESTMRAIAGSEIGAPELNTGHGPLYDFPVTVRRVEPVKIYDRSEMTLPGAIAAADRIEAILTESAQRAAERAAWRVVDATTGETVTLPADRTTFRGETARVVSVTRAPEVGKSGKVYATIYPQTGNPYSSDRYPSVFGLRIVPTITADMAGCWLDGHQGWHNNYRVVDRATEYGFVVPDDYRSALTDFRENGHDCAMNSWDAITGQGELSDMATDYLNNNAPDGFVFVWDMGELSLMTDADAQNI